MNQPVTISARTADDAYGDPTYAAGVVARARVQSESQLEATADGSDLVSVTKLFLPVGTVVARRDQITLPDGNDVRVIEIYPVPDGQGDTHHLEVMCSE